jgi:NTP pyrophosphatase (non-canonical NTP hydrolase)
VSGGHSSLTDLRDRAYEIAKSKGWYEEGKEKTPGEAIALMHSELSEALEEVRDRRPLAELYYETTGHRTIVGSLVQADGTLAKPCGFPSELADVIIRILDFSGRHGIDIERAVLEKMDYNATRPVRHGDKAL